MTISADLITNIIRHADALFATKTPIEHNAFGDFQTELSEKIPLTAIYIAAVKSTRHNNRHFKENFMTEFMSALLASQAVSLIPIDQYDSVAIFQLLYNNANVFEATAIKTAPVTYKEAWQLMHNNPSLPKHGSSQKYGLIDARPLFIEFQTDTLDARGYDLFNANNQAHQQIIQFHASKETIDPDDFTPELKRIYDCLAKPQMAANEQDPDTFRIEAMKFIQSQRKNRAQQCILTLLQTPAPIVTFAVLTELMTAIDNIFSPPSSTFHFFQQASLIKFKKPYGALLDTLNDIQMSPKFYAQQFPYASTDTSIPTRYVSLLDADTCTLEDLPSPDKTLYDAIAKIPDKTMIDFYQQLVMTYFIERRAISTALATTPTLEDAAAFLHQFKTVRETPVDKQLQEYRIKYQALVAALAPDQQAPMQYAAAQLLQIVKTTLTDFRDHYDHIKNLQRQSSSSTLTCY